MTLRRILEIAVLTVCTLPVFAQWAPVPPLDPAAIQASDFDDSELEVPFFLTHLHRVANAVVETGDRRGFLDIKINREPKDNEPYNARILENHVALSYFYCTKRPWNPYYGSQALKVRLEAMLQFWCRIQNPKTGLFSEYSPDNWSLAPTGFGVMSMSRTLELLSTPGGPSIDPAILEQAFAAQRKAIMALLTRDECVTWGKSCSNQFSGVYRAAAAYLSIKPDTELEAALYRGADRAMRETQSPAGNMYEASGVDVGYSSVHDNNLRNAWPLVVKYPQLHEILLKSESNWNKWLSYDLVLQPGTNFYFVNSGVNTRTAFSIFTPSVLPWSDKAEVTRAFAKTKEEQASTIAEKRKAIEITWPKVKELAVPSTYAYIGGNLMLASMDPGFYFPTNAERDAAISRLPYLAQTNFNHLAYDPRQPTGFLFLRRPSYYAAFNFGKILVKNHQSYGLGLLWNDRLGTVLQSVGGTEWCCGTSVGASPVVESTDVKTEIRTDHILKPAAGSVDVPGATVTASYAFASGRKTVTFDAKDVAVDVECTGDFTEQLPLVKFAGEEFRKTSNSISLSREGVSFVVEFEPGTQVEVGEAHPIDKDHTNMQRILVRLYGKDKLSYRLRFSEEAK